jgi:60 kDa SS-A/Ro ribonucleoprotein
MRLNAAIRHPHGKTHEGAPASPMKPEQALARSVMSCMLWENEFYEDGVEIADRIVSLVGKCDPEYVSSLACEARTKGNLRHVPLLLTSALSKSTGGRIVADTIAGVVQRADELSELLAVHARLNGVSPNEVKSKIPAQMKKGLARAFQKFSEYQLAKYNRDGAIKLRDVLFLCHAKPWFKEQADVRKRLVEGKLATPDTWEVKLSGGSDKKETFERLLREGKLGYLALLRNLRNMSEVGCRESAVRAGILARKGAERVLPFRYVAAARAAPRYEPEIDKALLSSIREQPTLRGKTIVLVDVSGSMMERISANSDLTRMDAAAALASIVNCENLRVFTFSASLMEGPPRRGMAGVDAIINSQHHSSTYLGAALHEVNKLNHDRLIVITDEQSNDAVPDPVAERAYMINVSSCQRGVGYGRWTRIHGFSESVIRFIHAFESQEG